MAGEGPVMERSIGLGVLLGVVTSMRYMGGYLLLLIPLAAIVLPALQSEDRGRVLNDIRSKAALHAGGAAVLLLAFAISYLALDASTLGRSPDANALRYLS